MRIGTGCLSRTSKDEAELAFVYIYLLAPGLCGPEELKDSEGAKTVGERTKERLYQESW